MCHDLFHTKKGIHYFLHHSNTRRALLVYDTTRNPFIHRVVFDTLPNCDSSSNLAHHTLHAVRAPDRPTI